MAIYRIEQNEGWTQKANKLLKETLKCHENGVLSKRCFKPFEIITEAKLLRK